MNSVNELLNSMMSAYAGAKTYIDTGNLELTFIKPDERRTRKALFETWFERPDRFRMDYRDLRPGPPFDPWPTSQWTIWANSGFARRYQGEEVTHETGLDMALGRMTGVAHGVPFNIPCMLLPDLFRGAKSLAMLHEPRLEEEGQIGTRRCYRITGSRFGDRERRVTLWVDTQSLLIHRVEEKVHFGKTLQADTALELDKRLTAIGIPQNLRPPVMFERGREEFDTEQTIDFEPQINLPIYGPVFEFTPGRK